MTYIVADAAAAVCNAFAVTNAHAHVPAIAIDRCGSKLFLGSFVMALIKSGAMHLC